MVWVGALLGVVPACSKDPTPSIDAATPPADAARDGSVTDGRACNVAGDCPCFSNYDCPPTHACVSAGPSGASVSCLPGPRGTGVPGSTCTGEADCASALCVDDATGGMRCSDLCTTPLTCPAELPRCLSGIGICAR